MPRQEPSLHARPDDLPRRERGSAATRQRRPSAWRLIGWLLLVLVLFPPVAVIALRWLPPPTSAFMLGSDTRPVRYDWVPASQIAEVARKAVVASEDQKFWEHDGFDLEAIEKAREHNKRSKKRRGASTISQQTAKNLFLWSGGGYFRKGVEAGYTLMIEALWPKQRILEVYLNIAEFGPGIYGVEAASQAFFGKPAAKISATEAARLAAVLPSPRRWSAKSPGPYVQKRVRWILGQMGYGVRTAEPEPPPPEPEESVEDFGSDEATDGELLPESPQMTPETNPQAMPEQNGAEVPGPGPGAPTGEPPAESPAGPVAPAAALPPPPESAVGAESPAAP